MKWLTSDFLNSLPTDSIDILSLSDNSKHIVAYVAGYISHSLIQRSNCDVCFGLLQKDQMNNYYIDILNRGGLQLPTVVLHALCILESLESQISILLKLNCCVFVCLFVSPDCIKEMEE